MRVFFSIALTLFLVIDALGSIPVYLSLVQKFTKKERMRLIIRELLIALGIMIAFHYLGQLLLSWLGVTKVTVQMSGGIILFLIAIRLIFKEKDETEPKWSDSTPFIVPIATPLLAGPSVLAVIMMLAQEKSSDLVVLGAIILAWFVSSIIYLASKQIHNFMKNRGLLACQRLMGLIVAIIAVQTFLRGLTGLLNK